MAYLACLGITVPMQNSRKQKKWKISLIFRENLISGASDIKIVFMKNDFYAILHIISYRLFFGQPVLKVRFRALVVLDNCQLLVFPSCFNNLEEMNMHIKSSLAALVVTHGNHTASVIFVVLPSSHVHDSITDGLVAGNWFGGCPGPIVSQF